MKRIFILCMFALFTCVTLLATPYTQKVEEIYTKYYCYCKHGYNGGLTMEDGFAIAMFGPETAARLALANYAVEWDASLAIEWTKSMEQELEDARYLMNDDDFYNEFLATQLGQLTNLVKTQFKKTYVKDEFETLNQYRNRAQENAKQSFDSICEGVMADFISSASFVIKPVSYNAETGIYNVKFIEKYSINSNEVKNEFNTTIPMESGEARKFKELIIATDDIVSVKWCVFNNDIHAQTIIFNEKDGIETSFRPGIQNSEPLIILYDDFREVYPLIPGHSWDAAKLVNYYNAYDAEIRKKVAQYNHELESNPYYHRSETGDLRLSYADYKLSLKNKYNRSKLENEMDSMEVKMKANYNVKIILMQISLRNNNPDKFIELYAAEHPDFDNEVKLLMNDYKCYDYTYNDFAFFIIDKRTIPEKECYYRYIELFNGDAEFNSYYADKDKFMAKVKERQKLKAVYFRLYTKAQIQDEGKFNFKGAANAKNQEINHVYIEPFLQFLEMENWRNEVFAIFLRLDPKMAKEYAKTGSLFKNNGEFFEAYVSDDYKKILKSKE